MTRLFTAEVLPSTRGEYVFEGEEARYLTSVLRMKVDEEIILCDREAKEFHLRIVSFAGGSVLTSVIRVEENRSEPPYHATLYQALVKGDKMDLIIQKAVELGVSRIVPVLCARSIVRLETGRDGEKKRVRWQKIAEEAARQSGRGRIPVISEPVTFEKAILEVSTADLRFLPWEAEKSCPLSSIVDAFSPSKDDAPTISFLIGPEGGFSESEINRAQKEEIPTVTLGKRILRTETAGLAVLSMLIYRLEGI